MNAKTKCVEDWGARQAAELAVIDAAWRVDEANARRANAFVQDQCFRIDYENSLGAALDRLRLALDALAKAQGIR